MGLLTTLGDSYAISLREIDRFGTSMDHERSTPAPQTQVVLRGSRAISKRYGFIQAKRKASDRLSGDFAPVLDQAVRQIAAQANDGIAGLGVATRTINRSSRACHQFAVWRQLRVWTDDPLLHSVDHAGHFTDPDSRRVTNRQCSAPG
jgi:hypothetical protein